MPETKEEKWRMFCAINLPPELRQRIQEHIARLREAVPDARASWNRDEKLHLTIKFLGDVATDRVANLSLAAERAVAGRKPFKLAVEGNGSFPPRGQPRVLWIGIKDSAEGLAHLYTRLEEECAGEGFAREPRAFHPHLTIARLRNPQHATRLAVSHNDLGFSPMEFSVSELVVIRSELGREGSRYTEISRHRLGLTPRQL
jgi:RNA 2',3'-cyclic 3'-phosphodiesterase